MDNGKNLSTKVKPNSELNIFHIIRSLYNLRYGKLMKISASPRLHAQKRCTFIRMFNEQLT